MSIVINENNIYDVLKSETGYTDDQMKSALGINESDNQLVVTLSDPEHQIQGLIEYIKELSLSGHSFNVVVNPDDSENRKEFFIDGDGADRISDVKLSKVNESVSNDDHEDYDTSFLIESIRGVINA